MKFLGVDYGLRRIGFAVSEGELANPWKIIEVKSLQDAVEKVSAIIKNENFEKVIVGLPEGKMGKIVIDFVKRLKKKGINVETTDETLSSKNATSLMIDLNIPKKKRAMNDSFAASQILQNFLDDRL